MHEIELLFWHDCVLQYLCTVIHEYTIHYWVVFRHHFYVILVPLCLTATLQCVNLCCVLAQWCNVVMRGR